MIEKWKSPQEFTSVSQDCEDGELRLVGGPSNREGRVEMCYMGVWGAISDDRWNENNAVVTCRQLGFEPSGMWTMQDSNNMEFYTFCWIQTSRV